MPDHNHTVKLSRECGFHSEGAPACCGGRKGWRHLKRSVTDQVLHFNFNYPHAREAEHLFGLASSRCASPWRCHHLCEALPSTHKSMAWQQPHQAPTQPAHQQWGCSPRVPTAPQCRESPVEGTSVKPCWIIDSQVPCLIQKP